jgi:DNA-binding helix-hairpin-helix protein with protein kinase domain
MKKITLLTLLFVCFGWFAFAQTEPEPKMSEQELKELHINMENLQLDLKEMMEELHRELSTIDIDLSGLDSLIRINWKEHTMDSKALAYLESGEFEKEMEKVQEEVNRAMEEVKVEMKAIEEINWKQIEEEVERAIEEVKRELEEVKRKPREH